MSDQIATQGVHHFRLTVGNVLSNGAVGLGIGPHPYPDKAMRGARFDENRIGLDHMSVAVSSRAALDDAVRVLDRHGVAHSEIRDLGEAFGICILIVRDPDNGSAEQIAEDIATFARLGVSELIFDFRSPSLPESLERMERFATTVMPAVR